MRNEKNIDSNSSNSYARFLHFNNKKKTNKSKLDEYSAKTNIYDLKKMIIKNKESKKIRDFLSPTLDETDFDDVLTKDKRTFCQFFREKFKNNQIFINSFCVQEIMRPRALKLLLIIMTIELYFIINALFYNEEYLSEVFNSTEEENFFSFVPRRFNQFVYTSVVNKIISYLIGFFFIEEDKLKRIFMKNKDDKIKFNYELSVLLKDIQNRFIGLIIMTILLSIIFFVYISCFNIVYPNVRTEWIKSSLFIIIVMQILNFLLTFFESILRIIALKYNSHKIYKLYLWLD